MKTDEQLYSDMCRGDLRAFDALYERFERRLFGFLLDLLKNREDAEEVFHDAFQIVITEAKSKRGSVHEVPARFDAWLFTVAKRRALNRLRAKQTSARLVDLHQDPWDAGIEAEFTNKGREAALTVAVGRLPPRLSEVYRLRAGGLSYEEIAARLDVPVGTVRSRIHALVVRLKEEMKQWNAR